MARRKNRGTADRPMSEDWKNKIRAGVILDRLNKCVAGEIEMTPQQVRAADIILKKIVPDLSKSEVTGADGGAVKSDISITVRHVSPDGRDNG